MRTDFIIPNGHHIIPLGHVCDSRNSNTFLFKIHANNSSEEDSIKLHFIDFIHYSSRSLLRKANIFFYPTMLKGTFLSVVEPYSRNNYLEING